MATTRVERRGEDADARHEDHKRSGAAAPLDLDAKKLRKQGQHRGQLWQNGQRWSCDVGSGSQGGSWGARAAATGAGGVQRREKRSAHLLSRFPASVRWMRDLLVHALDKKMERARHAREIRDLQEARARVSGLHGAWETQSAYGTHVGSRNHRPQRAQEAHAPNGFSPSPGESRRTVGKSYIR